VVGLHFNKLVLFGSILVLFVGFVFYKLLILFLLLQMVEEGFGPGGL
jgi:hypothetical protein